MKKMATVLFENKNSHNSGGSKHGELKVAPLSWTFSALQPREISVDNVKPFASFGGTGTGVTGQSVPRPDNRVKVD